MTSLPGIGWRAIFQVNPPVIVALVDAMIRLLPADHLGRLGGGAGPAVRPRLDVAGAVLVTASVAALIFGLSQGQQHGFGAPLTLVSLVAAVALGGAFVGVERRAPAPMVPLAVLTDPSRRVALGVMFTVASVIVGYVYFITLYMQRVLRLFREQGYDATTIEQIIDAADVSETTFFRYFPTKEDVVLEDDYDPRLIRAFQAQPPQVPPAQALRAAFAARGHGGIGRHRRRPRRRPRRAHRPGDSTARAGPRAMSGEAAHALGPDGDDSRFDRGWRMWPGSTTTGWVVKVELWMLTFCD